jgi:hypothetical protein
MKFDNEINEKCVVSGDPDPTTCKPETPGGIGQNPGDDDVPPSTDDRCADPAFAAAHPELCQGYPQLILKPETSTIERASTVQYRTFLRSNGDEQELTNGLSYSVADIGVAVIHVTSGLLTGSIAGVTTVSVQWQNLKAFAQVQVVENCTEQPSNFLILIDNSKSSTVSFNGSYSSRLTFSKEAARRFIDKVNFSKDKVAVGQFSSAGEILLEMTDDKEAAKAVVAAITSTTNKTNIGDGLDIARNYMASDIIGNRVIILFSDGENNEGEDPVAIADIFKQSGGYIAVVALRAWGQGFDLLYRVSSGGFFLSAYDGVEDDVITSLIGIKVYTCSADCAPTPGTFPKAALNYDGFINWDVFQGKVDLIGLGLWDIQPGNGLYVDLAGTAGLNGVTEVEPGGLKSKETFAIESGKDYRFQIDVGGNNVGRPEDNASVRCRIMNDDTVFFDYTITPTSDEMPLTQYSFDFTAADSGDAWIQIEMLEDSETNKTSVGPLIDDVIFENVTDSLTLLEDDFNDENPTVIPPEASYYGCVDAPPGPQSADPTPPVPPLEG